MNNSGFDEVASEPEVTEELITPLRNRPWKYIPQFTGEECRWLRVERTGEEDDDEEEEVEGEKEEEWRDEEDQGLLQYYRHKRTLEANALDGDMNGDLEVVELAKVIYGRPSALTDDRQEVHEDPIVPLRIVRRTEVEFGLELGAETGVGEPEGDVVDPEPDETLMGEVEPLVEAEEHHWKTFAAPPTHFVQTYLEPTGPETSGDAEIKESTITPFALADGIQVSVGSDDLEIKSQGQGDHNQSSSTANEEVRPGNGEVDMEKREEFLDESKHPFGLLETPTDPDLEASEPRTEVVEELLVETTVFHQTRPLPVFTYTGEGVESGSEGPTAPETETETREAIEAPSSGTSGGSSPPHRAIIAGPPERVTIPDIEPLLVVGAEDVKVTPGNKGGTLPPPGTNTPPEKPPRARRTKSETFFGFLRRKSRSKEREKAEIEPNEEKKELGERTQVEGGDSHSAIATPTTTRSREGVPDRSTQPSKPSFFQKFGFGRTSKKNNEKQQTDQQKKSPEVEESKMEGVEGCSTNVEKASTLPKQSSGKTNIRIFEIMANNHDGEPTPEVSRSSLPVESSPSSSSSSPPSVGVDIVRGTVGSGTSSPSQLLSHQSGLGNPLDSPHTAPHTDSPGGEPCRSALYDDRRTLGAEGGDTQRGNSPPTAIATGNTLSAIFEKRNYIVAVAIDFGTAFSGYAFCFLRDQESIHMMGRWEDGDPGLINQKTPTTLLLTPTGEFHSFGFTARNNYHDLDGDEAKQWLYFDRFKMALYESQDFSDSMTIEAANGTRFPGVEAISMTLRFFRDHALLQISSQSETRIVNDDVLWIVTVPAIWNASAKQLMRLAAYKAGLVPPDRPDQLQVALEPEAASVHIRRLQLRHLVPEKPVVRPLSIRGEEIAPEDLEFIASQFNHVVRYMVVDSGGGTVDITVHEMDFMSRRLQELHAASGGPHGSFSIDRDFERLLEAIFGSDFVQSYRRERPSGWIGLMMAFESRKRAADPRRTNPLNVALPFSFIEYHRKSKGVSVDEAVRAYADSGIRWSSQGMLRLSQETMKKLFSRTLDNIKASIENVLGAVKGIDYIFLVGGLSESSVFQCDIREHFRDRVHKVIIPQEANLAVIKGALTFGLDPTVIAVRRSKLTYGAAVLNRFVHGRHPQSKLVTKDGAEWCRDVFDVFVAAGQVVRAGEKVVRQYIPAAPSQKRIVIGIYSTEDGNPGYVSDPGVRKCANVSLDLVTDNTVSGSGFTSGGSATLTSRRRIQAELVFAETEVRVTATDTVTGRKVNASIDFLNV